MPRPRRACDACFKRKIQCDAAETGSRCDWCRHHGIPCTFVRRTSRPQHAPPAAAAVATAAGTGPDCRLKVAALGQIYISGHNLGSFCSRSGIPYFTPEGERCIYANTGRWPCLRRAGRRDAPIRLPIRGPGLDLPDKAAVQELLATYLDSDFRLVFPLVDGVLFERTIELAYGPNSATTSISDGRSARACVFAFVSIVSSRFLGADVQLVVDGHACAAEAQALLGDMLEDANMTTVQTLLILLTHETFCGRLQAASMYHSVACRALFNLDAHVLVSDERWDEALSLDERERRHLRVLFWFSYVFDKDVALCTGRPPVMDDDFCDLTLPAWCDDGRFAATRSAVAVATTTTTTTTTSGDLDSRRRGQQQTQPPWFPGDLRLSVLKSRACRQLYSAASLRQPDAELLRAIRELDEALERWRLMLPPAFSPSLAPGQQQQREEEEQRRRQRQQRQRQPGAPLDTSRSMLHMELHLHYYYLVNVIHAAAGRCAAVEDGPAAGGLRTSLELSVEASRSTLQYLRAAAHRLISEGFWIFIFYPMSALVTLFFNVLRDPTDAQAADDVDLLSSASEVIKTMPVGGITARELAYLTEVDDFVAELGRLARCALARG
ncbi:hypothetical protein CP533_3576 [Ophiocordyceps camponoti-saundersi (nom. inval.)]|nr:hypothetical protein CP533_3576 [Ophiocordyceps camponoti-saundersi (nom. inval.)]